MVFGSTDQFTTHRKFFCIGREFGEKDIVPEAASKDTFTPESRVPDISLASHDGPGWSGDRLSAPEVGAANGQQLQKLERQALIEMERLNREREELWQMEKESRALLAAGRDLDAGDQLYTERSDMDTDAGLLGYQTVPSLSAQQQKRMETSAQYPNSSSNSKDTAVRELWRKYRGAVQTATALNDNAQTEQTNALKWQGGTRSGPTNMKHKLQLFEEVEGLKAEYLALTRSGVAPIDPSLTSAIEALDRDIEGIRRSLPGQQQPLVGGTQHEQPPGMVHGVDTAGTGMQGMSLAPQQQPQYLSSNESMMIGGAAGGLGGYQLGGTSGGVGAGFAQGPGAMAAIDIGGQHRGSGGFGLQSGLVPGGAVGGFPGPGPGAVGETPASNSLLQQIHNQSLQTQKLLQMQEAETLRLQQEIGRLGGAAGGLGMDGMGGWGGSPAKGPDGGGMAISDELIQRVSKSDPGAAQALLKLRQQQAGGGDMGAAPGPDTGAGAGRGTSLWAGTISALSQQRKAGTNSRLSRVTSATPEQDKTEPKDLVDSILKDGGERAALAAALGHSIGGTSEKDLDMDDPAVAALAEQLTKLRAMRMEQASQLNQAKFQVEMARQEAELARLKRGIEREKEEDVARMEHQRWVDAQKRELAAAKLRKHLAPKVEKPAPTARSKSVAESEMVYQPSRGFSLFCDFSAGMPVRVNFCTLAYGFFDGPTLKPPIRTLPVAECEREDAQHNLAIFSAQRSFKNVPALSSLRCIVELQQVVSQPARPGDPPKTQSLGWGVLQLFSAGQRLNVGYHKVPMYRPPVDASVSVHHLQELPRPGGMDVYVRLAHDAQAEAYAAVQVNPLLTRGKYNWAPGFGPAPAVSDPIQASPPPTTSPSPPPASTRRTSVAGGQGKPAPKLGVGIPAAPPSATPRVVVHPTPPPASPRDSARSEASSKEAKVKGVGIFVEKMEMQPSGMKEAVDCLGGARVRVETAVYDNDNPAAAVPVANIVWQPPVPVEAFASLGTTKLVTSTGRSDGPFGSWSSRLQVSGFEPDDETHAIFIIKAQFPGQGEIDLGWAAAPVLKPDRDLNDSVLLLPLRHLPVAVPYPKQPPSDNASSSDDSSDEEDAARAHIREARHVWEHLTLRVTLFDPANAANADKRFGPVSSDPVVRTPPPQEAVGVEHDVEVDMHAGSGLAMAAAEAEEAERLRKQEEEEAARIAEEERLAKEAEERGDVPREAFIMNPRPPQPTGPIFKPGDGFDLYVDQARFLPDNTTITKLAVRISSRSYKALGPPREVGADLDCDSFSPIYHFRSCIRVDEHNEADDEEELSSEKGNSFHFTSTTKLDPTLTSLFRIHMVCGKNDQLVVAGYACLALFTEASSIAQPEDETQSEFRLNSGSFQVPLRMGPPQRGQPLSASALDAQPRIPCASLLVRVKHVPQDATGMGVDRPMSPIPPYMETGYFSDHCAVLQCERELYRSRLARKPFKIRWALKAVAPDEAEQAVTDEETAAALLKRLEKPKLGRERMMDYMYLAKYNPNVGFKLAIVGAERLKKVNGLTQALVTMIPQAASYYLDPKSPKKDGEGGDKDGAGSSSKPNPFQNFTALHDFESPLKAPKWFDNFQEYVDVDGSERSLALIEVIEMKDVVKKKQRTVTLESAGWSFLPLFTEDGYVMSGAYQLPLYHGDLKIILPKLKETDFKAVIEEGLKMSKKTPGSIQYVEWSSVVVAMLDSQRGSGEIKELDDLYYESTYLPANKIEKYMPANNPGKALAKIVPKGQSFEEYEDEMTEKFTELSGVVHGDFGEDDGGSLPPSP